MPTHKKKSDFFESEEGLQCLEMLKEMTASKTYNTKPSFSANGELYPDHLIPFVNKHMDYLKNHPSLDPMQYMANLRLMTHIRG